MADITPTPANVIQTSGPNSIGTAGMTIVAGRMLYLDAGLLKYADATSTTKGAAVGMSLNGGATGQPITYATSGLITLDGLAGIGSVLALSKTAASGLLMSEDEIAAGYLVLVGIANSATQLNMAINRTGLLHA